MVESDTGMQVDNEENFQPIHQFARIRNMSRLLNLPKFTAQVTNYNQHTWISDNCLNHLKLQTLFENHKRDWLSINDVSMIIPKKKKILRSRTVYADFECMLGPIRNESRVQSPTVLRTT